MQGSKSDTEEGHIQKLRVFEVIGKVAPTTSGIWKRAGKNIKVPLLMGTGADDHAHSSALVIG